LAATRQTRVADVVRHQQRADLSTATPTGRPWAWPLAFEEAGQEILGRAGRLAAANGTKATL
jgi:hypothetical protein